MDSAASKQELPTATSMRSFSLIQMSGVALLSALLLPVLLPVLSALPLGAATAATGGEPAAVPQVDIAPCLTAAADDDMDKATPACAAVIDNEKTAKPDLVK